MLNKRNSYRILRDKGVVVEYHEGILTKSELIEFKKNQWENPNYSPDFNIIVDLRDVQFDFALNEINEFIDFLEENKQISKKKRLSFITQTPNQTALATLFLIAIQRLNQFTRVFATTQHAIHWLKIEKFTVTEFEYILDQLRENTSQHKK